MDQKSPTSSMESTGDTSRLLKELMDLQKSTASASASIDRSLNVQDSDDNIQTMTGTVGLVQNSGDATDPTMTEFMKTIYDASGSAARQLITLQGTDTANSFSVYGQEVDIVASKQISSLKTQTLPGSTLNTGSNKVKTTPVVNYDWEQKRYVGNIVAVHRNNVFAGYVLKGKSGGVVRVTNRKTAERTLLKDFVGRVIDLAFAHTDDVILAVVDEIGNLCVYEIKETDDRKIEPKMLLHVHRPKSTLVSEFHRVIWCPYIPDDCDDSSATDSSNADNACRMLVLTNEEKAEIWSVDLVTKDHGVGPVYPNDVEMGLIRIESHTKPIMDCAFSPDGTALATASLDGEVKFFQVYMNENTSPRCLHQWKPHGGKPMSCLFFLDDHKNVTSDAQFWKFAVTGADNNQEIKIWSCESWNCLQTVRFLCPQGLPSNFSVEPCMKAALDLSARYFIMSDIRRRVLYVLQLHQDNSTNSAHVSSVSEFTLAQPCLSFAILDAGTKRFKKTKGDDSHLDEITTGEIDKEDDEERKDPAESTSGLGVQIKLYTVHPKALQELLIRFKPESSVPQPPPPSVSSISQGESGIIDALSDVSMVAESEGERGDMSFSQAEHPHPPVLMTPDAFKSSPRKHYPDDSVIEGIRGSASSTSSFTQVSAMNEDFLSPRSSSGSTITQTPTTPKEPQSPAHAKQDVTTPSSVPLPPVTTNEETELATPNSSIREVNVGELTPTQSTEDSVAVDSFFAQQNGKSDLQKVSLDSTGSTGHFDVSESRVHQKSQGSYDEMDEEVAEVMGEDVRDSYSEDLLGEETQYSEGDIEGGTQPFNGHKDEEIGTSSGNGILQAWPKPPDVSGEDPMRDRTDDNSDQNETQEETTQEDYEEEDVIVEEEENIENLDDQEEENEDEDDGEKVDEEEEEIEEQIEEQEPSEERTKKLLVRSTSVEIEEQIEEQEPSKESLGGKEEPKAAPVAGFAMSPRDQRPVEVREIHKEIVREVLDPEELQKLHSKIESILQCMEAQQSQMDQLRQDMIEQQSHYLDSQRRNMEQEQLRQVSQEAQPSIEEHIGKLENIVTSRVERLFATHAQKENQRMQDLLRQTDSRDRQKQDQLVNTVSHTLALSVVNNLERNVKNEFKNTVAPAAAKALEPVKEQLHQELAQKLTATDALLKDNIGKMVRSRQTIDAIGVAAGNAIQKPVQAAYRETFQNIVIPSFERATQNMCQQVGDVFQRGTKEYTRQLESHMEALRQKQAETRDPMVSELRKLTDSFQTSAEQMKSHVIAAINSQLQTQVQNAMSGMQDKVLHFVREAVKEEVSTAVKEQGVKISDSVLSAMRSGAVTPAVSVTPDPVVEKQHVLNLLRQGQLNAAFQQALSASNLEIVMMLCETVNPSQVFNQTPCPLHQPVLLSLIQQLSADLDNNTILKHKYLEEAVMNLDQNDTVTQEHIKGVLYGLIQKLKLYIQAHPNDKMTKSLRMLLMASESFLK